MIIIKLMGGLGNQLQQYALYKKYISLGTPAKLDLSWFEESVQRKTAYPRKIELDRFAGVKYEVCSSDERSKLIGPDNIFGKIGRKLNPRKVKKYNEYTKYDSSILSLKDMYLEGYFACEYYYADILDTLRKELILPTKRELNGLVNSMSMENSVSIHLRRGDYLDEANKELFGSVCTEAYYESAIEYVLSKMEGPSKFYIFSDDLDYAREYGAKLANKYKTYTQVVDVNTGDDSCYDIFLMSKCHHNICANSTFSFWGARLNLNNDKIMVSPTVQRSNQDFVPEDMHLWWKDWVFIDSRGEVK